MRPRWIMLLPLLTAIAMLAWLAWPKGDNDTPQAGASQQRQERSTSNPLHADSEKVSTTSVAKPQLVGNRRAGAKRGADSDVPALHADPEQPAIAAYIAKLSSKDAEARCEAADEIVKQRDHVRVARHGSSLDDASWQAFVDAVMKKKHWYPSPACAFVSAAHVAPHAHRRRLIKLATRLNPEAGKKPTLQEIEALVRHELVVSYDVSDHDFFGQTVAIYGHMGMVPALRLLREGDPGIVDRGRGGILLSTLAQPEDIPVLRGDLLKGRFYVASALGRLDYLGYTKAVDVLIEAVRSGLPLEGRLVGALARASQRPRVAQALREWVRGRGKSLTDENRASIASLLGVHGSRADIPLLEAWSSSCRDQATLLHLGSALAKLGSVKGIEQLVRVVGEKNVNPPPRKDPNTWRPPNDPWIRNRAEALRSLNTIRVQLSDSEDEKGPWWLVSHNDLDRTALSAIAWWKKTKDKIYFDKKAGEWRFKSD